MRPAWICSSKKRTSKSVKNAKSHRMCLQYIYTPFGMYLTLVLLKSNCIKIHVT